MTTLLIFLLCLSLTTPVTAQSPFQDISFEKALKKAQKENKLIFLQYESEDCGQCNIVADKAFADKDFAQKLASEFIAIKVGPENKDRMLISEEYSMDDAFGTMFIDKNSKLLYTMKSTVSSPIIYEEEIKTAYKRQQSFKTIEEKEKSYFNNSVKSLADLEQLIQAKTHLNLSTDLLLTEYINLIPKDSINSIRVLQFLIMQAPVYRSKSDIAMRSSINFDNAWYALPLNERVSINGEIFNKSIRIAAQTRDEQQAKAIATEAMGTATTGKQNFYDRNMMQYYTLVKDTAKYLGLAAIYYNRYVNSITDEYVKRIDSIKRLKAFANPVKIETLEPLENGKQMQRQTVRYVSPYSEYANYISRVTNFFSNMDKNNAYLQQSIQWAQRSVDLSANPANLYLLSQLLYKAEKLTEAVNAMEKAIELTRKFGYEQKEWNATFEKMKQGQPLK